MHTSDEENRESGRGCEGRSSRTNTMKKSTSSINEKRRNYFIKVGTFFLCFLFSRTPPHQRVGSDLPFPRNDVYKY